MLGLHCLGNLSHLDSGSGRAAEMKAPPPLRNDDCRERQLDVMQEGAACVRKVGWVVRMRVKMLGRGEATAV